jgi:hypothetical protein
MTMTTFDPAYRSDSLNKERLHRLTQRSIFQRINDWLFGYDFFISYRWSDGREYALKLAEELQKRDYECFLDTHDYLPWGNWIIDGSRAIKKTQRLIFICTPDALVDPQGRGNEDDPIIKELTAFDKNGRNKVRINIKNVDEDAWMSSKVSVFFTKGDFYKNDFQVMPSDGLINELNEKFNLERIGSKRLRVINLVCATLVILSIGLSLAFYFAVSNYRDANEQQVKATHNLGMANLNEASRLAAESRRWDAINLIGKTNGIFKDNNFLGISLVSENSEEYKKSVEIFFDLLNNTLRPVSKNFPTVKNLDSSAFSSTGESVLSFSSTSDGELLQKNILLPASETIIQLPERLKSFSPDLHDGSKLLWLDIAGRIHLYDPKTQTDSLLGLLDSNIDSIHKYWIDSSGELVAFTKSSDAQEEVTLWVKRFDDGKLLKLDGAWKKSDVGVFVDKKYLLMVGQSPFSNANAALFDVVHSKPISTWKFSADVFYGKSGALYPEVTTLVKLSDSESVAAIGMNDGSVRTLFIRQPNEVETASSPTLFSDRTLRWSPTYNSSITSLAFIKSLNRLAVGTEDGMFFIWSEQAGQLLNAIKVGDSPIKKILEYDGHFLTIEKSGNMRSWKDRIYSHRASIEGEAIAIEITGENTFDVYTENSVVLNYTYTPDGFKFNSKRKQDFNEIREDFDLRRLPGKLWLNQIQNQFPEEEIAKVEITSDKSRAVISFKSGYVELWDIDPSATPVRKIWRNEFSGSAKLGVYMAISPDNEKLAIAGYAGNDTQKKMAIYSMADGKKIMYFQGDYISEWGNEYPVIFVNNGQNIITSLYGYLYSWPVGDNEILESWLEKKISNKF